LHTSDWHLGRTLCGRTRYDEFEAFLDWLAGTVAAEEVDALLVTGDVFDTTTPSNRAQAMYYRFLCRVGRSGCRHVVVVGGNHDSPTFLEAPRDLLRSVNVHVIGAAARKPEDEVLVLRGEDGVPRLIVAAVPYLRDRDLRTVEAGESAEDKTNKLVRAINSHYARAAKAASDQRAALRSPVPLVATGHLFAAGGRVNGEEGERPLYIGSLVQVGTDVLDRCFDYVALGHLHAPQAVGGLEHIRYSGAPLPMAFDEASRKKSVCLVDFEGGAATISTVAVPRFRRLEQAMGSWPEIAARLEDLAAAGDNVWVEVVYRGTEVLGDLRERVEQVVRGTSVEVLRVKNQRAVARILSAQAPGETLEDLTPEEVFARCLDAHEVPRNQRGDLRRAFDEIIAALAEADTRAE